MTSSWCLIMFDNNFMLITLIIAVFLVAFSAYIKIGKKTNRDVVMTDDYEDEDLTVTLLNMNDIVNEADFK